jgi:hypothetical protein
MVFIGNQPTAVPLTSSQLVDGIITTAKIADGAVVNVDVNSTAAIAYSKLNLATSIVNGDIANATINLTQKVTGTLPTANGGTGLAALGTAGQALVVNSTATALEFATVGATAGQVIQVLSATDSNSRSTSSASFVTASNTLTVTITPASASNKVFIIVSLPAFRSDGNNVAGYATIYRGATNLGTSTGGFITSWINMDGSVQTPQAAITQGTSFLDSPATTSATTYQVYFKVASGSVVGFNQGGQNAATATITVMEIKG